MGQVQRCIPDDVLRLDDVTADLKLDTGVLHVHLVLPDVAGVTLRFSERALVEHVTSLLDEEVETDVQTVPDRCLETGVEVAALLPCQVGITAQPLAECSRAVNTVHLVEVAVNVNDIIAVSIEQVVVTLSTVTHLYLQVVQPVHILQEGLFLQTPRTTDSPERTPAVILVETRRTVATDTGCEIVLVCVVVLTLYEVTLEGILCSVRIKLLILSSVGELRIRYIRELSHVTVHPSEVVFLVLMTEEDVHVVQTCEGVVPVDQLVNVQSASAIILLIAATTNILGITADWRVEVVIICIEYVVSHVGGELKVVQEGPLEVTARTDVVTLSTADA